MVHLRCLDKHKISGYCLSLCRIEDFKVEKATLEKEGDVTHEFQQEVV